MRNFLVVVLGVCLSVLCLQSVGTLASPEEVEPQTIVGIAGEAGVEPQEMPQIQPRITCDLMSGWVWGERLCAAHCIAKGYRGGWCDSHKVCNCRK